MVIGLVGISGVGKSFLKLQAVKSINNLTVLFAATTRPIRNSEIDGIDKYFMTEKMFFEKHSKNEMFLVQEIYGFMYAFLKKDVAKNSNYITEMLYTDLEQMKLFTEVTLIYVYPKNAELIHRNLLVRYKNSILLQKKIDNDALIKSEHEKMLSSNIFDYTFENYFDESSVINFISLISKIVCSSQKMF